MQTLVGEDEDTVFLLWTEDIAKTSSLVPPTLSLSTCSWRRRRRYLLFWTEDSAKTLSWVPATHCLYQLGVKPSTSSTIAVPRDVAMRLKGCSLGCALNL